MNWIKRNRQELGLTVPCKIREGVIGEYQIIIARRPHYCDRGDWLIYMNGRNDIDWADGFPRYFFGTEEEVKAQVERFVARRKGYHDAIADTVK